MFISNLCVSSQHSHGTGIDMLWFAEIFLEQNYIIICSAISSPNSIMNNTFSSTASDPQSLAIYILFIGNHCLSILWD